jgi:hypothetical protein
MSDEEDLETAVPLDKESVEAEITAGARAFTKLLHHASDDWTSWTIVITGLRALRDLAFANAHTTDMVSYDYRQEMGRLLRLKKYSVYDQMDKPTRSACYKLMDSLDEITAWYMSLPVENKLQWKHPKTILKYAPGNLIEGGRGGNRPPRINKAKNKKRFTTYREEQLMALVLQLIQLLMKYEPETAAKMLDQVRGAFPADEVGTLGVDADEALDVDDEE